MSTKTLVRSGLWSNTDPATGPWGGDGPTTGDDISIGNYTLTVDVPYNMGAGTFSFDTSGKIVVAASGSLTGLGINTFTTTSYFGPIAGYVDKIISSDPELLPIGMPAGVDFTGFVGVLTDVQMSTFQSGHVGTWTGSGGGFQYMRGGLIDKFASTGGGTDMWSGTITWFASGGITGGIQGFSYVGTYTSTGANTFSGGYIGLMSAGRLTDCYQGIAEDEVTPSPAYLGKMAGGSITGTLGSGFTLAELAGGKITGTLTLGNILLMSSGTIASQSGGTCSATGGLCSALSGGVFTVAGGAVNVTAQSGGTLVGSGGTLTVGSITGGTLIVGDGKVILTAGAPAAVVFNGAGTLTVGASSYVGSAQTVAWMRNRGR